MSGLHLEDDLFFFESDHLALKGNKDYSEVLKTVLLLSVHRENAIRDYKKVSELKEEALKDPNTVVTKIKNKEDLGFPLILDIPKLPKIDFGQFSVKFPLDEIKQIYSENSNDIQETHNFENKKNVKQWTVEEQKRLEELLEIYPPEPIEMKRFQKIAKALGTRTVQQVCSRVQKYFIKLYKAGLPVPGRLPKHYERHKSSSHKHQKYNSNMIRPTTFFPELNVPVSFDDIDKIPGPSSHQSTPSSSTSTSNYLITSSYHSSVSPQTDKTDNELKLELLHRVKLEKLRENDNTFLHNGYSCDYCNETPIIGSRWHCITCLTKTIDFCTDCVISQLYSGNPHPLNHRFYIYTDNSESPTMETSDSELNSGNRDSSNESDNNYKVVNDSDQRNMQSDDDFGIKEEIISDSEKDDTNLSYSYLHSNLMFHEND